MGYARMRVSFEVLRELLHLPAGTDIRGIGIPDDLVSCNDVELTIAHPDLKEIAAGELPPLITPMYRKTAATKASVELVDWGQETTP